MIEKLLEGLQSQIGGEILEKTDVKANQLPDIFGVIGDTTKKEVKKSMLDGGVGTVMNLFSKKPNNSAANSLQTTISSGIVSGLVQKLGLSSSSASMVAGIALPAIMNMVSKKNSETPEDDPSPINALFGDNDSLKDAGSNLLNKFL